MLLYFNAAFSLFALMGLGIGGSAYSLAPVLFDSAFDSAEFDALADVVVPSLTALSLDALRRLHGDSS